APRRRGAARPVDPRTRLGGRVRARCDRAMEHVPPDGGPRGATFGGLGAAPRHGARARRRARRRDLRRGVLHRSDRRRSDPVRDYGNVSNPGGASRMPGRVADAGEDPVSPTLRLAWALCVVLFAWGFPRASEAAIRRYAVIVGNDLGAPGEEPLRYATSDARKIAEVLTSLGSVPKENLVLFENASAGDVERALIAVNDRIRVEQDRGDEAVL